MLDHTALIKIVTWFLLVTSALAIVARLSIKWTSSKKFNVDDSFILLALIFNIGAGVALSIAANNGLGGSSIASNEKIEVAEKALYGFGILYIMTVTFANLSIAVLLRLLLFTSKRHNLVNSTLGGFILAQGLSLTITTSFACSIPDTWIVTSGKCIDIEAFWRAASVLNIVADISLIILPCCMIAQIKIPLAKKMTVASCFAFRIINIAASATQLVYTGDFTKVNFPVTRWPWYLIGQVVQTTTIISSCVPYLRAALQAFPSGMFQPDEIRRRGLRDADRIQGFVENSSHSYILKDVEVIRKESTSTYNSQGILLGSATRPEQRGSTTAEIGFSPSTEHISTRDHGLSIHMSRSVSVTTWPKIEHEDGKPSEEV